MDNNIIPITQESIDKMEKEFIDHFEESEVVIPKHILHQEYERKITKVSKLLFYILMDKGFRQGKANDGNMGYYAKLKQIEEPIKRHPSLSIHPGKIFLEEVMKPHDISLSQASELLSIDEGFLNEIVNGTKDIDEKLAKKIAEKFGGSEGLWIRLQTTYNNDKSE